MAPGSIDFAGSILKAIVDALGAEWIARQVARLFTSRSALDAILESEYAAIEKAAELAEKDAFRE